MCPCFRWVLTCADAISCQADDSWTGFFFFNHFLHSHLILQSWLPLGLRHLCVQGGSPGVHIKQARHGVNPTKNRMTWAFNNISILCLYRIQPWMWGKLWSNRRSSGACYWEVNNNALVYRLCHLYVGGIGCHNGECRGHSKSTHCMSKAVRLCWVNLIAQVPSAAKLMIPEQVMAMFFIIIFCTRIWFSRVGYLLGCAIFAFRGEVQACTSSRRDMVWILTKNRMTWACNNISIPMFVQDSALNVGQTMEQQAFFWCLLLGSETTMH